jgi:hypothetical protein
MLTFRPALPPAVIDAGSNWQGDFQVARLVTEKIRRLGSRRFQSDHTSRRVATENSANFNNLCHLSFWNHQSLSRCQLFRIVDDIPIGIENLFPAH